MTIVLAAPAPPHAWKTPPPPQEGGLYYTGGQLGDVGITSLAATEASNSRQFGTIVAQKEMVISLMKQREL